MGAKPKRRPHHRTRPRRLGTHNARKLAKRPKHTDKVDHEPIRFFKRNTVEFPPDYKPPEPKRKLTREQAALERAYQRERLNKLASNHFFNSKRFSRRPSRFLSEDVDFAVF